MAASTEAAEERDAWRRQESRVVRPFKSAEHYLSDSKLKLFSDGDYLDGPAIQVDRIDRDRLAVALRISTPPPNFQEAVGASLNELSLVISIEDRVLKRADVVTVIPLAKLETDPVDLGEEVRDNFSWVGETRIHVSVVLNKSRKAAPGIASRAGSWLARKTFFIRKSSDTAAFKITPVDPDYFEKRGLPSTTAYFVEIQDADLNQTCDNLPDMVKVCMNRDVHTALARDEESNVAKALVRTIYVDVVSTILASGFEALEGEIQTNSVLDVVTKRLSKATGINSSKLQKFAKDNGGAQLRAIVQAEAALGRSLVSATARRGV
jgi:hypothetical protein